MKKFTCLCCLLLTGFYACSSSPDNNAESKETNTKVEITVSEKEKGINQAVKEAYAFITFEKGNTPDYEALKALFTTDATLYNFRSDSMEVYHIDDFIAGYKAGIEAGKMIAFREIELGGKTEYFGHIGHRISAYATYFDGSDEIGEKGVNSFQVVQVNGKWLINSIIWDVEKNGQSIPEKYLTEQ